MIVKIMLTIANLFQYLMNLKKFLTLGDTGIFFICEFLNLTKQDIEEKYYDKLIKLDKEDKFYAIKLNTINDQRLSDLEAAQNFEKKNKKNKKKLNLVDYFERKSEALRNRKVKALIDFDEEYSSSIKSLAVKESNKVNLTTRYLNGKMLMFSQLSIKSFVYELIYVFMFPNEEIIKMYAEFKVDRCYLYQILTDIDSTSIVFFFRCDLTKGNQENYLQSNDKK